MTFEEKKQEGKDYWEPSEHHKNVWREEGREAERTRIKALVEGMKKDTKGRWKKTIAWNAALNSLLEKI